MIITLLNVADGRYGLAFRMLETETPWPFQGFLRPKRSWMQFQQISGQSIHDLGINRALDEGVSGPISTKDRRIVGRSILRAA